jgi:hypothetical protein
LSLNDIDSTLYHYVDINGATRQVGLSLLVSGVAFLVVVLPSRRRLWEMRILTAGISLLAFVMAIMAFTVRNPCRPNYYIGCGVNQFTYEGFVAAAIMFAIGIAIARYINPAGWLLMGYGLYYAEYMTGFYHYFDMIIRIVISLAAVMLATVWIYRMIKQWRMRRA